MHISPWQAAEACVRGHCGHASRQGNKPSIRATLSIMSPAVTAQNLELGSLR
jgi:hypothetical protein